MDLTGREVKPGLIATAALIMVLGGSSTFAGQDSNYYYVYADVVDVEPILSRQRVSSPHSECTTVPVRRRVHRRDRHPDDYQRPKVLPALIGGLVGGLIGNQFGKGHGKEALTFIGAFTGAQIARSKERRPRRSNHYDDDEYYFETVQRERCETSQVIETVERLDGYQVTYLYLDHEFVKTTREHPGDQVRIRVELSLAVDEKDAAYASL